MEQIEAMGNPPINAVLESCRRLQAERRSDEAIDLLESAGEAGRRDPTWWMWKGALLLDLGRARESEELLTGALLQPGWPTGHAGIARWLAIARMHLHRWSEAEEVAAPWARRGDLDCMVVQWRAMLHLGKAREVLARASTFADGASRGNVGVQLVLLEALLDLGGGAEGDPMRFEVNRTRARLANMVRLGCQLDPDEAAWLDRLDRRMTMPVGFGGRS